MERKSILIVEDEIIVARNIERMLSHVGYHVIAIEQNGLEALRIAREHHPDIILMDIKLEGEMDGVDTGQKILDELFIPIIYITAHADENTIQRATKTQPFGYLYKPISRNALITAIEVALFKHEAEKRVRESEARFRGLVENSPTGILHVDRDGTILDANPKLLEILGSPSLEETRKINFFSFPPLVDSGATEAFQNCMKEGRSFTHEHPYTSKWGKTSHLRYHLNPVRDSSGIITGVQANIEDISDRVEAEEALRRSEENFRTLTNLSPVGIFATDAKGRCIYVNRRWTEISGMSMEDALGDGWRNGLHPDDRESIGLEWEKLMTEGGTLGREYRFLSEDGVTTWVYGLASPLKDEMDRVTGFIGINLNITQRKHTEERLRESEDRFRTFFEGAPDAIILAEIDSGRIIDANRAALKLLGRTHEEVLDMHQGELHPPDMSEFTSSSFHEDVQQVQIQEHSDPIETVILRKDGTRIPVEVIAKLIHLQGNPIIHGTFRDIVKRKEAEQERERLLSEIEEKQEELQRVIYVASHDLRSPLLNVRGFSEELGSAAAKIESLVRDGRMPAEIMDELDEIIREDLHESVKYIGTSITKMESLIGGLLRISRIGTIQIIPEPVEMNSLLSEIRETFEFRLKERSIALKIGDLPACEGDRGQLNQVFSNLIDNAIKYLDPARKGEIEISGRPEGEGIVYSVRDNGIGIPDDHLKKIFDIFHRVGEGEVTGEGLGLTAVRRILDRHGGRIWVESREGEGSAFHVFLPGTSVIKED